MLFLPKDFNVPKKIRWKRIGILLLLIFSLMNASAWMHSYHFTHFSKEEISKTQRPEDLKFSEKLILLFTGISNPKPKNAQPPKFNFEDVTLQSNEYLNCWYIPQEDAMGNIILFHGYGGEKSSMMDKAEAFRDMGYNILLVDFMGSGASSGHTTTIGYHEAQNVQAAFDYIKNKNQLPVILFGTSMGAAAILKSIDDRKVKPDYIILECPFGTMQQTVDARFRNMGIPKFPMSGLLVFWGGLQNGFWAFDHNPADYARSVHCPVLLISGDKDANVSLEEIEQIYEHFPSRKHLKIIQGAGHENYLNGFRKEWIQSVEGFLEEER